MKYSYILLTILFTVYGQIVIKWRVGLKGGLPVDFTEKIFFLLAMFKDPWILSAFFSAFIASLAWMAAMTKFDLSYAYPFMSLSFVFVLILSVAIFSEPINMYKISGLLLIIIGIIIASRGM